MASFWYLLYKMQDKNTPHELGVTFKDEKIFLFYSPPNPSDNFFQFAVSEDGINFNLYPEKSTITNDKQASNQYKNFRISKDGGRWLLTYKNHGPNKKTSLYVATSTDLISWESLGATDIHETGAIVPDYHCKNGYAMYFGEKDIKVAFSENIKKWGITKQPVIEPRENCFDDGNLEVGTAILAETCILLIYYSKKIVNNLPVYSVGAATFYKDDPRILLWRSNEPLWKQPQSWTSEAVQPVGILYHKEKLNLYWKVGDQIHVTNCFPPVQIAGSEDRIVSLILKKYEKNPIIEPIGDHSWESRATFNSAAFYDDDKVHFLYRAIGDDDVSVLGYASSNDGIQIDNRLKDPAYVPTQPFECSDQKIPHPPSSYLSGGGGYGGCEDPRITRIGNRLYMTYVAFDGWSPPRVALTSISMDDFLNKRWNWETPKLISRPGEVNKNACIMSEKIGDKYVVFHRVFPNILIDYVDDLEFKDYLRGDFIIEPRSNYWDSRKIGAGPPPIKTEDGWLLIYQAVGNQDPSKYKIGAMLLGLDNPTKVICRSNTPILEPTEKYENEGHKFGVAYPCGAAVIDDNLLVYYGGADKVVCAARQDLKTLLRELKASHAVHLEPITNPLQVTWPQ